MDFEKDYYADLGVLPDVSKEVIRAVYLALAKRFHPDSGGEHADQEKFKTINTAYEVLYDENSRKEYDEGRTDHEQSSYNQDVDDEEDLFDDELVDDWAFAVEYYPELEELRKEIVEISSTLSVVFQSTILGTKKFGAAGAVKAEIVTKFLERYFGTEANIKIFAIQLLKIGRRDAARELNRAVLLFGKELEPTQVITKIRLKYDIPEEENWGHYY
jgi:curved DNA-binding protein CbpA